MSDFDAESNPLSALTDDLVDECQSESRIAVPAHASSSKQARAAASSTAAASLVQAPRFDKSSDAYWLDRAQRRAHQQPTTTSAADGSLAAASAGPRRVRKPRPKKGTRASAFMHFLFDTFDLRDRNRRAKQAANVEGHTEAANMAADSAAAPGPSPLFHVVDVAGGRGQLAFFLSAFHSIPVSVIDPAAMDGVRRYSDRYHLQRVQHRRARENHNSSGNSSTSAQTAGADDNNTAEHASPAGAPSLAAAPSLTPAATDPIVLPNGVVLPVPWLPELSHFRCMFPDSIALSQHKQFGQSNAMPSTRVSMRIAAIASLTRCRILLCLG